MAGYVPGHVIDASVAVKWFVNEAFSEHSARLLDDETTLIARTKGSESFDFQTILTPLFLTGKARRTGGCGAP